MKNRALDANLDFDGMAGNGVNRAANRYAHNQWSGHSNDGRDVRFGRGPTVGNKSSSSMCDCGPGVTKDAHKLTIATAKQGGKINGGAHAKAFAGSPDSINVGMKK